MYFRNDSCWTVQRKLRNCPLAKKETVMISKIVQDKVSRLNNRMGSLEWMVYTIGNKKNEQIEIRDVIIPRQVVTGVSVRPLDFPFVNGIIGTIHSHHGMGAFFSGQDHAHLQNNHDVTIVVSGEDYKVSTRVIAPCGNDVGMDSELVLKDSIVIASNPIISFFKRFQKQQVVTEEKDAFDIEMDNILTEQQYNEILKQEREKREAEQQKTIVYQEKFVAKRPNTGIRNRLLNLWDWITFTGYREDLNNRRFN